MLVGRKHCVALLLITSYCTFAKVEGLTRLAYAETINVTGNPAGVVFLRRVLTERGGNPSPSQKLRPLFPDDILTVNEWRIVNVPWRAIPITHLSFSDQPEKVTQPGMLWSGGLIRFKPVRLQYYHLGGSKAKLYLILKLFNPNNHAARLHIRKVHGGPTDDYFEAGHSNSLQLLTTITNNEGFFLTAPPHAWITLEQIPLPYNKVVSGTAEITLLNHPPLQYILAATPYPEWAPPQSQLEDQHNRHSRGYFEQAEIRLHYSYQAGDQDYAFSIGNTVQKSFWGNKILKGNYGVIYRIDLNLINPTATSKKVTLLFNPRGGKAAGAFIIQALPQNRRRKPNLKTVSIPPTEATKIQTIESWLLPPHSETKVSIMTTPEGASSYPVKLILRTQNDQATNTRFQSTSIQPDNPAPHEPILSYPYQGGKLTLKMNLAKHGLFPIGWCNL